VRRVAGMRAVATITVTISLISRSIILLTDVREVSSVAVSSDSCNAATLENLSENS